MNPHEKYRRMVKDNLKHEINNIALGIAIKNEEQYKNQGGVANSYLSPVSGMRSGLKTTYGTDSHTKHWRTP